MPCTILSMANLNNIIQQLQQERDRLNSAIRALTSLNGNSPTPGTRRDRTMSAAARARIAAAQRARWAKLRGGKSTAGAARPRRMISAAGLARIRAAQRARWAKIKRGKK